jgi:hypothetical protein
VLLPEGVLAEPGAEDEAPEALGRHTASGASGVTGATGATRATTVIAPEDRTSEHVAPALPTRVRQASIAPALRADAPVAAEQAEREITPDEMRAVFGAFQRGLDRGRKGLPARPGPAQPTDTEEGTDADDAQ